jgi:hypothetical protein
MVNSTPSGINETLTRKDFIDPFFEQHEATVQRRQHSIVQSSKFKVESLKLSHLSNKQSVLPNRQLNR